MGMSLYEATVPSFRQILGSVGGLIGKAEAFCAERGLAPEALIQAKLAEDMLSFAYQVKSCAVHSIGAIEGVRQGVFAPDRSPPPETFDALRTRLTEAGAALAALDPAEIDGFVGRDMRFEIGERRLPFVAEQFLLSFSQPNFYFHATTAYAILRAEGVPIGKRDFLGAMRMRD